MSVGTSVASLVGSRSSRHSLTRRAALAVLLVAALAPAVEAQRTAKPILHGRHWMAITGKPLGATAGARMFHQGGNAVDAAAAMLAATSTMWDVLSWGGETQALIYHPGEGRVIGVNALGVAPTGATPDHYRAEGHENFPPELGPLSAVTPGTPGGLMTMLAEWGRLSLADVLRPSIEMADGYPIEDDPVRRIRGSVDDIRQWPTSMDVYFTNPDDADNPGPREGEIFRQPGLKRTLERLVEAEAEALAGGAGRKEAIYAAYDAFYGATSRRTSWRARRRRGRSSRWRTWRTGRFIWRNPSPRTTRGSTSTS